LTNNIKKLSDKLNLPFELREYQCDGIKFLTTNKYALLADDMGLGKTIQVIVAIKSLIMMQKINGALIVVPSSLKTNWSDELSVWAPNLSKRVIRGQANRWASLVSPVNVVIASYQDISIEFSKNTIFQTYDLVVLDEAQKIKNSRSNISNKCKLIKKNRGWLMTGTPIENRIEDLCSLFDFLKFTLINRDMSKSEIHSIIKYYFLRRTKAQVLKELPPIIEQTIKLKLTLEQESEYYNIINSHKNDYNDKIKSSLLLKVITKLKQVCNFDKITNASSKLDTLTLLLNDIVANNKKVIIFSQYVECLAYIKVNISSTIECYDYTGAMSVKNKDNNLKSFKNSPRSSALLLSLLAGGVGLNIQEADYVIMFDRWWNPALEKQAINRAHRFGRELPLHVFYFLVENSIEDHILNIITQKSILFEEYVEKAENFPFKNIKYEMLDYLKSKVK